ncbi:CNH domain-containing protein [Kickxella alabastrina]|uniref:CNH domain-containing protein n=1 Tax=Kickxella alabastrina TaxID=61397 RepID=UPI002220DAB3|nr:CNH domain-containing protein [Kickxella alabastrina]KAI7824221.1 CNH domain-containing protein [Kickxella alabastrina]
MATGPTTQHGPPAHENSGGRKHKGAGFTSWLKKGSSSDSTDAKKLASPAEEIKMVFLRQLELSSFELNGRHYHSVFTGAQIVLASNVASRLIDCSLYTHVSGPSLASQSGESGLTNNNNTSDGAVIDSNTEIYTLTSEALRALKAMHKGEALHRAKTQTRKRYMDLREHLHPRILEPLNAINRVSTSTSATGNSASSDVSSNSNTNSGEMRKGSTDGGSINLANDTRSSNLPPPLDTSGARKMGAFFREREPHISSGLPEELPEDTLVARDSSKMANKDSHGRRKQNYLPITPTTGDDDYAADGYGDMTASTDASGQAARLPDVKIPTGDFSGLLNTWSFVADGSLGFGKGSRNSLLGLMSQSTSRNQLSSAAHTADASATGSLAGPIATPAGSMREGLGEDYTVRVQGGLAVALRRRGLRREYSDTELNLRIRRRRDGRGMRMYSSAPNLNSVYSEMQHSNHKAVHRPSLPMPRILSQVQTLSREDWALGNDEDMLMYMARRSSRFSDITIASSYNGVRQPRGMLLDRSFSYSEASSDVWPARSSIGSQFADIQSSVGDAEIDANIPSTYSSPVGGFVAEEDGGRQRSFSDPAGLPRLPRPTMNALALPRHSSQTKRQLREYATPDPQGITRALSEDVSARASSATLGSTKRHSESVSIDDGAMQLQLWRDTVPVTLLRTLGSEAVAHQEAIFEFVSTEHAYLRDLELIDLIFVQPLLAAPHVLAREQAEEFLRTLFFNYKELIANSQALCEQLRERQAESAVVAGLGDIIDKWADDLVVFVEYAVHVPEAQLALEGELLKSRAMAEFLASAEAAPGARRLPVQSFVGRAAARFARYPMLLDAIVRRAPTGEDASRLRSAAAKVRHALTEVDRRTGEGAAALRMRQINQRLQLSEGARESLGLESPVRRLVKEGVFIAGDGSQVLVFLFDNALVMAVEEKISYAKNVTRYIADSRIIPVSMLDAVVPPAEAGALSGIREALGLLGTGQTTAPRSTLLRHSSSATNMRPLRAGASLSFVHIGCRALGRTLLVASDTERDAWLSTVRRRICMPQTLVEAYTELRLLSDRDFPQTRGPQCSAPFTATSGCRMVLFGNRDGMHLGIYGVPTSVVRISQCGSVSKIHVLPRYNMAVVLSDQILLVFSLSDIENSTANINSTGLAGTKIASSVAFFDVGTYLGTPLIVLMKPRGGKSHFKCIQPHFIDLEGAGTAGSDYSYESSESGNERKRQTTPASANSAAYSVNTLRIVYQGNRAVLRLISEFAIQGKAKRVHFLRRKLCIVASKTFEIIDVANSCLLRSLPDPLDDDFSFIHANDSGQAMAICKVGREFLLCYETFAFYIDNFGRRSRPDVFIRWEMAPHLIIFRHPYIIAINQKFLEVRYMDSGVLLSIIRISGAVCLNPDSKSTTLHIAVGPQTVGTATTIQENIGVVSTVVDRTDNISAIPTPMRTSSSSQQLASLVGKAAAVLGTSSVTSGHVVPGVAGTTGKRMFPEGTSSHFRIVEIRLPPLKASASARSATVPAVEATIPADSAEPTFHEL